MSNNNISLITIKSACRAVRCSRSFLLLSLSCVWDVDWLAFLNLCSNSEEPTCKLKQGQTSLVCYCVHHTIQELQSCCTCRAFGKVLSLL